MFIVGINYETLKKIGYIDVNGMLAERKKGK